MPASRIQTEVLRILAGQRNPESYVAGGVPINRSGPRISSDIDIFHDRQERAAEAARQDAGILVAAGFEVEWLRELPTIVSALVRSGHEATKLEWIADSDYRFFPAIQDDEFGYVLSLADLAVNKAMAAAGRREVRDIVDLVTLHEQFLPLGAVIWAAVDVAPGFTPEGLIAEIRRNSRYPAIAFKEIETDTPIDAGDVMRRLRDALGAAEAFVVQMPSDKAGRLFLENGVPVQPDPKRLSNYVEHAATRRGHWPSSPETSRAMLERYLAMPRSARSREQT